MLAGASAGRLGRKVGGCGAASGGGSGGTVLGAAPVRIFAQSSSGTAAGERTGGGRGRGSSAGRGRGRGGGRTAGGSGVGRRFNCNQAPAADRQAAFQGPFPDDPCTAIIGGGLSGLALAHELALRGLRSVVFDTGEHGVGGRLATRSAADGSLPGAPPGCVFDHAAQYFTASDPAFQAMVERWEAAGAVHRWAGPVGTLRDGSFTPDPSQVRYVARGGMRQLAQYLAGQASAALRANSSGSSGSKGVLDGLVEVRRPQWVSDARHTEDGWQLMGRGRQQGTFDAVVVAHNGKCANRLTAPMGVPAVHSQLKRLKLSANWVLMVAFRSPVAAPGGMEGAFVKGSEVLSWAANNTAKLGLQGGAEGLQCWTLVSTQGYGRQNKVPQENVPAEVAQRVTAEMLAAFESSLGLPSGGLPMAVFTRAQLWGAALPINSPRVPCIWDPVGRTGVCGDWVAEGGSMQAAALSGQALAERIDASRGRLPTDIADLSMGLTTPLKPVAGEEVGQFPTALPAAAPPSAAAAAQPHAAAAKPQQAQRQRQRQGAGAAAPNRPAWQRKQDAEATASTQLLARPVRRDA